MCSDLAITACDGTAGCHECSRLIREYREIVRVLREAVDRATGALVDDAVLALRVVEQLHQQGLELNTRFLQHLEEKHPVDDSISTQCVTS